MAASSRSARDAKRRVQQMEAKRELRQGAGQAPEARQHPRHRRRRGGRGPRPGAPADGLFRQPHRGGVRGSPGGPGEPLRLATPSATPAATTRENIPKPETAAGKTFTGELELNRGTLGVELDGTKAPQAAAVFKSLADQNFYNGLSCHRLTTAETFGVLQCGSKAGDGSSDPAYTWGPLENTPPDNNYPAGTIAVARTGGNTNGNGTQFFIVYKDTVIRPTPPAATR